MNTVKKWSLFLNGLWKSYVHILKRNRMVQGASGLGAALLLAVILVPAITSWRMSPLQKPGSNRDMAVLGYYDEGGNTPDFPSSFPSVEAHHQLMDAVSPVWYTVMADGSLKPRSPNPQLVTFAHSKGLKVYPLFNNDLSGDKAGPLKTAATRGNAASNIVDIIKKGDYDGVHIDFQLVPSSSRDALTAFISELRDKLPRNKPLSIAVFPKIGIDPSVSGAYDYAALAKKVEFMVMMAYDRHSESSKAGPVSPNNWVEDNIKEFLKSGVPANKLVVAVGTYGYDWPASPTGASVSGSGGDGKSGAAKSTPTKQALKIMADVGAAIKHDAASGNPYFEYTQGGTSRVVWFQDSHMLYSRLGQVRRYKLKGIAIWRLGYEEPAFWETLAKDIGAAKKKK